MLGFGKKKAAAAEEAAKTKDTEAKDTDAQSADVKSASVKSTGAEAGEKRAAGVDAPSGKGSADSTDVAGAPAAGTEGAGEEADAGYDRAVSGPWDVEEQETDEEWIDLGALRVRPTEGMAIRLDVDERTQEVVSVTFQKEQSAVQVQAFAAPKSRGIWPEIRTELAQSARDQNGVVDVVDGPLGRQVMARIPADLPDGGRGFRVARFVGVDGPRWFLRGVFSGDAAVRPAQAAEMEEVFRSLVVVRGSEPMAPRDVLALRVPEQAVRREDPEAASAGGDRAAHAEAAAAGRQVPERGPEITQIG